MESIGWYLHHISSYGLELAVNQRDHHPTFLDDEKGRHVSPALRSEKEIQFWLDGFLNALRHKVLTPEA